jgi:hypothetical protein
MWKYYSTYATLYRRNIQWRFNLYMREWHGWPSHCWLQASIWRQYNIRVQIPTSGRATHLSSFCVCSRWSIFHYFLITCLLSILTYIFVYHP